MNFSSDRNPYTGSMVLPTTSKSSCTPTCSSPGLAWASGAPDRLTNSAPSFCRLGQPMASVTSRTAFVGVKARRPALGIAVRHELSDDPVQILRRPDRVTVVMATPP
ncbi:MAG TPA: hypothetical protein VES60_04115 [Nakamurella sp.]|nr:hypothetical protein [Nakamurella sp.]